MLPFANRCTIKAGMGNLSSFGIMGKMDIYTL